jgi:cysteinyl-tRNA synthetase
MSSAPDEVRAWAQARSDARVAQDWPEADRLRAAIEAAGWRIIDRGSRFSLEPAHAPDLLEGDRIRYGSSRAVPSRLDEPATAPVTVILVAVDQPADLARTLDGLRQHGPAGSQVVIVADRPDPAQEAELVAADGPVSLPIQAELPEVVWTSEPLGRAAAVNAGLRRAAGSIVVLLDTSVELAGDLFGPLVAALDDQTIAVAGPWGLVSDDLRRFEPGEPGEVDAIDGVALAFRRADVSEVGFLDEHFRLDLNLDIWWSLVLRDGGEASEGRRAVAVPAAAAAAIRHDRPPLAGVGQAEHDRLSKRSFYRVLDRFGSRRDLLTKKTAQPS